MPLLSTYARRMLAWRDRLQTLTGEFRRSPAEQLFWYVAEAAATLIASTLIFIAYRGYQRTGSPLYWYLMATDLPLLLGAIYAVTRNGRWYRLQHGTLIACRRNGTPVWQENLAGLRSITPIRGRGGFVTVVALRWTGHTRRFELVRSLEQALAASPPH